MAAIKDIAPTKRSKASVDFEEPAKGAHHCGQCQYFMPPKACKKVRGVVDDDDWCKLFKMK